MTDRYFIAPPIAGLSSPRKGWVPTTVALTGSEAHQLIHVMRARPGSRVVLFDGSGSEFPAKVTRLERTEVELLVTGREPIDRELPLAVTLGAALPKGDCQRWLVEKAVELGVRRLVPLLTARSVAQPVQQALERLRRTVIQASKQCGRNRLMEVSEPQALSDYVAASGEGGLRLLSHPRRAGRPHGICWPQSGLAGTPIVDQQLGKPIFLAVGPEGGFAGEEVAQAEAAGWQTIDLGPRILRVETAALLLVAIVTQWFATAESCQ